MIEELSIVAKAIRLLEAGASRLKQNPFALEEVMNEIDNFWGVESGRLEKELGECANCGTELFVTHKSADGTKNLCEKCCDNPMCDECPGD